MGVNKKNNIKWTESIIQDILNRCYLTKSAKKYQINGLYVFSWESDYLCITKSGLFHEIEIKISREDFFNDFKNKKDKHNILNEAKNDKTPNFFYYCVPENLISIEEVPEYAGLIYVINEHRINVVKKAPQINKNKPNLDLFSLTDKFYYNMVKWRENALKNYEKDIELLKEEIKLAKIDSDGKKYKYTLKEAHSIIKCLESEIDIKQQQLNFFANEYHYLKHNLRKAKKMLKDNNIDFIETEIGED